MLSSNAHALAFNKKRPFLVEKEIKKERKKSPSVSDVSPLWL